MASRNQDRVGGALDFLNAGLPQLVERELKLGHGRNGWSTANQVTGHGMQRGGTELAPEWDAGSVIKVPWKSWNDVLGMFRCCGWQSGLARGTTHPPLTRPTPCRVDAIGYFGPRAPRCHGAMGAFAGGLPTPGLRGLPVRPVVSRAEHRDRGSRAMVTGALLASRPSSPVPSHGGDHDMPNGRVGRDTRANACRLSLVKSEPQGWGEPPSAPWANGRLPWPREGQGWGS